MSESAAVFSVQTPCLIALVQTRTFMRFSGVVGGPYTPVSLEPVYLAQSVLLFSGVQVSFMLFLFRRFRCSPLDVYLT